MSISGLLRTTCSAVRPPNLSFPVSKTEGAAGAGGAPKSSSGPNSSPCVGSEGPPLFLGAINSTIVRTKPPTPAPIPNCSAPPSNVPCSGLYIPCSIRFWPTPAANSCSPSTPASLATRLADAINPVASDTPRPPLSALTILRGLINSVAPTPAPSRAARPRSSSVAPPSRARSLASPAPAPTPKAIAAGIPTPGIAAVPAKPRKEPTPSPNLRPIKSSEPLSAEKKSCTGAAKLCILSRSANSVSSPNGVIAPRAALSSIPAAPPPRPLKNSSN